MVTFADVNKAIKSALNKA